MNAIRNLLKDHEEVYKPFNQFVDAGEEAYKQKQTIAEKAIEEIMENARLVNELTLHLTQMDSVCTILLLSESHRK